jgi:tetratricopeptide (TPR) repeat protein
LALVLSAPVGAYAQEAAAEPTPAQVRTAAEAFDRGREAYKAEEYIEAAEQFEKADNSAPSSAAIELAIRARDKAGEIDRAATLLALALKRHPSDQNLIKLGSDLDRRVRAELFQLNTTCDTPCDLTVGGKIVHGPPDTQRTLFVLPGALTVRAGWSDNRSEAKQIQAEKGGTGELAFVTPPPPENTAKAPTDPGPAAVAGPDATKDEGALKKSSGWPPTIFFVGAGLTAVAGGITVWSGIDTVNNPGADKVEDECRGQGDSCALYQEGLSKQRRTNILIGVTAGLGVATLVVGLFATDWSGGKSASAPAEAAKRLRPGVAMAPWASLDGGGLQAVGRF